MFCDCENDPCTCVLPPGGARIFDGNTRDLLEHCASATERMEAEGWHVEPLAIVIAHRCGDDEHDTSVHTWAITDPEETIETLEYVIASLRRDLPAKTVEA